VATPNAVRKIERRAATRDRIIAAAWDLARDRGLTGFALRDVGARVGMRAPSLYEYFSGKNDLYDAMYAQGWSEYHAQVDATRFPPRSRPRARAHAMARCFVSFAVADPTRFSLLNQRVVPGFEPSEESWSRALEDFARFRDEVAAMGVGDVDAALDLLTALLAGLLSQQLANDPGGERWTRRTKEVVDMWLDHYEVPTRRTPS
jgi:AcrR family transcriptional regulator